jgi:hypothetical protein
MKEQKKKAAKGKNGQMIFRVGRSLSHSVNGSPKSLANCG